MAIINYIEKHLKTFTVKTHKHNYWEIIYVTDGVGTIETEDKQVIEYKKGEKLDNILSKFIFLNVEPEIATFLTIFCHFWCKIAQIMNEKRLEFSTMKLRKKIVNLIEKLVKNCFSGTLQVDFYVV